MIPTEKRVLAIDYGSRWLGLAWSDPSLTIVAGSRTIDRKKSNRPIEDLVADIVKEIGATHIVVGMPYNMNGSAGFKADETLAFISRLEENLDVSVSHLDERLTTVRAEEELRTLGGRRNRERRTDELSASFILQEYLSSINSS